MLTAARTVAIARIGLGAATVLNAFEAWHLLGGIADGKVALPVVDWMPAPSSGLVAAYLVVAVASGLALALGWRASASAVVVVALNAVVLLWDQQTYSSHRWLATLLVLLLVFAHSDATWALRVRPGPVPRWPMLLMMTQLSVCYFFAAVSKVNQDFLGGGPLRDWMVVPGPLPVFVALSFGTVLVELLLAVGLWWRRGLRLALASGVLLHLSIVTLMRDSTMQLIAFAITCVALYPLFVLRAGTTSDYRTLPVVSARERLG